MDRAVNGAFFRLEHRTTDTNMVWEVDAHLKKKRVACHRPPNINIISYYVFACLFSVFITFCIHSYGTSHLEKLESRMYYEDTKKE